jgi:hypothetical protein
VALNWIVPLSHHPRGLSSDIFAQIENKTAWLELYPPSFLVPNQWLFFETFCHLSKKKMGNFGVFKGRNSTHFSISEKNCKNSLAQNWENQKKKKKPLFPMLW